MKIEILNVHRPSLLLRDAATPLAAACMGLYLGLSSSASAQNASLPTQALTHDQVQMLDRYCSGCHNLEDFAGGMAVDLLNTDDLMTDAQTWEAVLVKLKAGMMPPLGEERPPAKQVDSFVTSLAHAIDAGWAQQPQAGAPLLHRMNRREYQNAIRDLLDLPIEAKTMLPEDATSDGFDNMANVLSVSPALMQAYVSAANRVSRLAVGDMTTSLSASTYRSDQQDQSTHLEGYALGTRGGVSFQHVFPLDGNYEVRVSRGGVNAAFSLTPVGNGDPVELVIDGERVALFTSQSNGTTTLTIPAGPHQIEAAFVKSQSPRGVDDLHSVWANSVFVGSVTVTGPLTATGPGDTPSRRRIFICQPGNASEEEPCAQKILQALAYRAFRRPVSEQSMKTLMAFYQEGRALRDFDTGIQYGLSRILVDPRFVFRFEEEPDDLKDGENYAINDYELASRLSFFLWSSIPDDELLSLAAAGKLAESAQLDRQIKRMLNDPKAQALVQNFGFSWLSLAKLDSVNPTSDDFDGSLRVAMKRETELLLESILLADRPVKELLTANYTFVNERLARHYGIPYIRGSHFRKVDLTGTSRFGLLGQGSILTITSAPNRTSPVIRGSWIMGNILGAPPPPPPPGVETNLEDKGNPDGMPTTMRQRMERHREEPSCAACHNMMDPIGFALENFDPVGKFRHEADGSVIDNSAVFWDGSDFAGADGLQRLLLARSDLFVENFTQKLMTYAMGRKMEYFDMPAVRSVVAQAAGEDFRFSALVKAIALSEPFTSRTKGQTGEQSAGGLDTALR